MTRRTYQRTRLPPTRRGKIVLSLVALPFVLFFNLLTLAALGSAAALAVQSATGTVVTGVITDSSSHTVQGRRGPDETYCYGLFSAADGSLTDVRVRVYVDGYCFDADSLDVVLVPGLARPFSDWIIDPATASVGDPMPFNGLFGMTRGAVIDPGAFAKGLLPFAFLLPVTLLIDIPLLLGLRRWVKAKRGQGRGRSTEG